MAKGFKHGAGGGGAPLNFKVVGGTTEPVSPKENTIWVNTDVEITGWAFRATEPETPSEGMVWIPVGTTSPIEFNALKKNGIQVYPLSAKQYVSGAWVDKTAQSYQNGVWVAWVPEGYLYINGNQCTHITGGWRFVCGLDTDDYYTGDGELNENSMDITVSETWTSVQATTKNKIDLTNYSKLKCKASGVTGYLQYGSTAQMGEGIARKAIPKKTSAYTTTLDISSASGSYYVAIQNNSIDNVLGTLSIYEVWLE